MIKIKIKKFYEEDSETKIDFIKKGTNFDAFKEVLKNSLKVTQNQFEETLEILETNSNQFANEFDVKKSFLIYGDVQSGKTNNLINYVVKLLDLNKIDLIIYLTGRDNDLLEQNQSRFSDSFEKINPEIKVIRNAQTSSQKLEFLLKDKKIILNSLKTKSRLDQIEKILFDISPNTRTLIIDDEADDASLSESSRNIFKNLKELKNLKFLSITATPFSNLLVNHDFYDSYIILKSPAAYNGIEDFKNNFILETENNKEELPILKGFVYWICVTSENDLKNSQYLVNVFTEKPFHEKILYFLKERLSLIKKDRLMTESNILKWFPQFKSNISKIWEFITNLSDDIFKISNSDSSDEVKNFGFETIIGGFKISRGITYKNLICETMLNMSSTIKAGTLLQRARWFGYRGKNMEFIKIFVDQKINEAYEEACRLIEITKNYNLNWNNYKELIKEKNFLYLKV